MESEKDPELIERATNAISLLENEGKRLADILKQASIDRSFITAKDRVDRWKERVVEKIAKSISAKEADKLYNKRLGYSVIGAPLQNLAEEIELYRSFLLTLREDLTNNPADVLTPSVPTGKPTTTSIPVAQTTNTIFIIHGHDELNTLRLDKLLKDKWNLTPITLASKPSKGRTLIEKFEEEAQQASFAFALLTPDDFVNLTTGDYMQSRPNVLFELGWFYGRLKREHVCILHKKDTKIPSDLEGIARIEFSESVLEKEGEIKQELLGAKILTK